MTEEKKEKFRDFLDIFMIIFVCLLWFFLGFYLKSKKEQMQINNNNLICASAQSVNKISNYNTITDLTGTTWQFYENADISGIFGDYFSLSYDIYENDVKKTQTFLSAFNVSFMQGYIYYLQGSNTTGSAPNVTNVIAVSGSSVMSSWYIDNRIIEITGGSDSTDLTLISWLQSNATQIQIGPTQLITPTISKDSYNVLSWSAVTNATSYEIYKDNELYDTTINTLYTVTALGSYQVIAIGDGENYSDSELSNTITFTNSQLDTPYISLSLNGYNITWSAVSNATSYEIYIDNELVDTINTTSYTISVNGNYQVKSISNSVFFTNSELSNLIVINYQYATVTFYAKDNITELLKVENWLIGKDLRSFNNNIYSWNNLLTLISSDSGKSFNYLSSLSYYIMFNDNQLFSNVFFNYTYIISSDIDIYYQLPEVFTYSDNSDYTVTSSDSDTLFTNLGDNLLHSISLSSISVNFNFVITESFEVSEVVYDGLTILDNFELGNNFSVYTDSFGNDFYFDCVVTQQNSKTYYTNYLYKYDIKNQSFYLPLMDYNLFTILDTNTNKYVYIGNVSNYSINYTANNLYMIYEYELYNNFYYCNYMGFSFDIQNYYDYDYPLPNTLEMLVKDNNNNCYRFYYNPTSQYGLNYFNYVLINSDNFNNYKYSKTSINLYFKSQLGYQGLSSSFDIKSECVTALENLTLKFSFGNPIIYYYDSTDKTNNSTGVGLIPTNSNGLYKTDFAWYDVTSYIYNFFVYLIFDMPLVSNITKLVYLIINLILFIINQIILLFSGVTNNIFLVAILGFLLLKFVISLLVKH